MFSRGVARGNHGLRIAHVGIAQQLVRRGLVDLEMEAVEAVGQKLRAVELGAITAHADIGGTEIDLQLLPRKRNGFTRTDLKNGCIYIRWVFDGKRGGSYPHPQPYAQQWLLHVGVDERHLQFFLKSRGIVG